MNVVLYRKYVVYGWTPVLSSELSDVFRSVYDAERVWLINGQILLGWVWKNMYRPVISTQLCDYKQICHNELMLRIKVLRFFKHRRLASLIFVNKGIPIILAENVAKYV